MRRLLILILLLTFTACGSAETTQPEEDMVVEESAEVTMDDNEVAEETMTDDDSAMMDDDAAMSDEDMTENPDALTNEDAMADEGAMVEDDAMHDGTTMTDDEAMSNEDNAVSDDNTAMAEEEIAMEEEAMVDTSNLPVWQTLALTNAHTGETFTLADFAGKTVFVEPMATWCTNCRHQLNNVQAAKAQAGEDVVFIGLSLETTLASENLADYATTNGFDFIWAVLTPEMVRELAAEFGQTVTNAPSTPHFIISPDGSFTPLVTGIEPASELLEQIEAAKNS